MYIPLDEMGRRLREQRQAAGLTQKDLAERIGVSRPMVTRAETQSNTKYLATIIRGLEELGTSIKGPYYEIAPVD